jgi:hypothetical protein
MIVASITMVWRLCLGKAAEAIPSSPMVDAMGVVRLLGKQQPDK